MRQTNARPFLFATATLTPLGLFGLGIWLGGLWSLAALIYMTVFATGLDQISGPALDDAPEDDAPEGVEFPAGDGLLVVLALAVLALLPVIVWAVAASDLSGWARLALFLGAGLWLGQVANPAAHELIHRADRNLFRLGVLVYALLLFGHHASAHRLVHHTHAASLEDPNTARFGEGYYRFALRAWGGSFRRGYAAETVRRKGRGGLHPYVIYSGIALLALASGYVIAGGYGVLVWLGLAAHAQSQLLLSDYVQHYGLLRLRRADGKLEPIGPRHSWNTPHWFSSAYMLNAPRHSDHHAHPARPYPALRLPEAEAAPMLPWPLPFACLIALVPPLWKRAIRPHLNRWRSPA